MVNVKFWKRESADHAAERRVRELRATVLDRIAPDTTEESKRATWWGSATPASLLVYDKPATAVTGWRGWLTGLLLKDGGPEAHGAVRLSITWSAYSSFSANLKLTMAETSHTSTLSVNRARGWVGGHEEQRALADVERVQRDLADAATKLLKVCVVVTCEAPTASGLDAVWAQVVDDLNSRMLHWRPLDDRHALGFAMQDPAGDRPINHPLTWDTGTLALSWPAVGNVVDMGAGPVWGTDGDDGRLIRYDPSTGSGWPTGPARLHHRPHRQRQVRGLLHGRERVPDPAEPAPAADRGPQEGLPARLRRVGRHPDRDVRGRPGVDQLLRPGSGVLGADRGSRSPSATWSSKASATSWGPSA